MRAAVSSPDGLVVRYVALPKPGPLDLLVKVSAAGMNRADLNAAKGGGVARPEDLGKPIGMEWSGTVVETGSDVSGFAIGDQVACSGSGGYAQYAVCDARRAIPIAPDTIEMAAAATLPLALMTAHNALTLAGFTAGDTVVVHGASSAVGIAAIRIARLLGAGTIAATARNPEKRSALLEFGADHVFAPEPGWTEQWRATGHEADVLVDMIAGPDFGETLDAMAVLGRAVLVGRLGGTRAEFDLDRIMLKRLSVIGATFRTRTIEEVAAIVDGVKADVWPHVLSGALNLPLDRQFSLEDAGKAHVLMASDGHFGKIVIVP